MVTEWYGKHNLMTESLANYSDKTYPSYSYIFHVKEWWIPVI